MKTNLMNNEEIEVPIITVIIPTYHDWDRLQLCLNALQNQSLPEKDIEIIVVNNNPYDLVPDTLYIPSNAKIINEGKPGSYAARNKAVREAQGTFLAFTDSDCIPDKDWLSNALEIFSSDQNISRIGGKVSIFCENEKNRTPAELYDLLFAFQQKKAVNKLGYSVTANLIVRKEDFLSVGYFNDKLFSGGDHEWNMRAKEKELSIVYAPDVIVNHPARKTIAELEKKRRRVVGSWKVSEGFFKYTKKCIYLFLARVIKPSVEILKNRKINFSEKLKLIKLVIHLYIATIDEYNKLRRGGIPNRE